MHYLSSPLVLTCKELSEVFHIIIFNYISTKSANKALTSSHT